MSAVASRLRRLPAYGAAVRDMIARRERPVLFSGAILISLDWDLGTHWTPRIVIPRREDPASVDLSYLRGCDVLIIFRPWHPREHVRATVEALAAVGANCVHPVALPSFE